MSATNKSRSCRKFKRAGAVRKKACSMISNENGISSWWLGQARNVAKQIRRETH